MRWMVAAAVAAGLVGCSAGASAPTGDAAVTAAVLEAYRQGDRAALTAALDGYAQLADPAAVEDPCSLAAYKQRRLEMIRKTLARLDNTTVLSMSEEARLVHLQNVVLFSGDANLAEMKKDEAACKDGPSEGAVARAGGADLARTAKALIKGKEAWEADLKARNPADLDVRMRQAQDLLERNNIKS